MSQAFHIAVIDDHKDIRELLVRYLGEHGYRVSAAESVAAFRRQLDTSVPDLLVLDIMMPGDDGLTLCRERASGCRPFARPIAGSHLGPPAEVWDRSIDNQVSRLRRKIEADPAQPALIKTCWGDGYQFVGKVRKS
jgi:DNA-binding response OmpR family regulator